MQPSEPPFLFSEEFTGTPRHSSGPAQITSSKGSFPNLPPQNAEADAAKLGLRPNASLKARLSSSARRVIARQKLLWRCWFGLVRRAWHTRAQPSSLFPVPKEMN